MNTDGIASKSTSSSNAGSKEGSEQSNDNSHFQNHNNSKTQSDETIRQKLHDFEQTALEKKSIDRIAENTIHSTGITKEDYDFLYRNYSVTIFEENMNDFDDIKHNVTDKGITYLYGMPSKNNLPFTDLIPVETPPELPSTPTQNLYSVLELDKDSSYESLVLRFHQEYNTELDMYGDIIPAGETKHEVFEWGIPIPLHVLKEESFMKIMRTTYMYNKDIPGNVEDIHPNKFIANIIPKEELRHTPIVPISEKDLKEYQRKIEEKNRVGIYFEVKRQTLYYYFMSFVFFMIFVQVIRYFYHESEKATYEYEKIRFRRYRNREEEDIF